MDRDLDPLTGEWWVGLASTWRTIMSCVLGYPAGIHWFMNHRVIRCDLARGGMDLIAQLLLESRTCAFIEWLANELIMTANKIDT